MTQILMTVDLPKRPVTVLIAAMGGDGGGLLADWIVAAATQADYPVQSSSIPGVAQRTGATHYYLEIYPVAQQQLDGRVPVMALSPMPGAVDVVVASELMEAGRALRSGMVSLSLPTTVIASTHRVYATAEKVVPGDGRADSEKVLLALRDNAGKTVLFDMEQAARQAGCRLNAVQFGALAGSGVLPLPRAVCEHAIREGGKGIEESLRGFGVGFDRAEKGGPDTVVAPAQAQSAVPVDRVRQRFPAVCHTVVEAGVKRLTEYQDLAYAHQYLDRLESVYAVDREAGGNAQQYRLTCETARLLALWMSYEDLIRVAELKTRQNRFERVRKTMGARPDDLMVLTEYLKPGLDEVCSMLSPKWAAYVAAWAKKNGKEAFFSRPLRLRTSTVHGFLVLKALAGLKPWRRNSARFKSEQAMMDRWLGAVKRLGFAVQDVDLALEIVECARVVRGYGETRREGIRQFETIFDTVIESGRETDPKKLGDAIRRARLRALGNPEAPPVPVKSTSSDPGKPIFWMPRVPREQGANATGGVPSAGCR